MKRFLTIFVALLCVAGVDAQTIALQNKTPRFKHEKWLNGNVPQRCDFTYIEFIHSKSQPCRVESERIYQIVQKIENMAFVLISNQAAGDIDEWVMRYITPRSGVIVDDSYIRRAFGVSYAPYAVIIDHKRKALWFGNPQLLDKKTIEKLIK
ncbi:MAG: hypothetical protein IKA49_06080 [Alistipes sp.]|nr:hypothetical protein [Alistipes sp.]